MKNPTDPRNFMRRARSLVLAGVLLLVPSTGLAAKLHVILVADTVGDLSVGVERDLLKMRKTVAKIVKHTGLESNIKILKGSQWTAKDTKAACVALKDQVGKDDTVIFYYGGHGFNQELLDVLKKNPDSDKDKDGSLSVQEFNEFFLAKGEKRTLEQWPEMRFSEWDLDSDGFGTPEHKNVEGMKLTEVYKLLHSYNPRLLLVLGDCCNNLVKKPASTLTLRGGDDDKAERYKKLFLESKGGYIASAAKLGQFAGSSQAKGEEGGFFTAKFLMFLDLTADVGAYPAVEWETIFNLLIKTPLYDDFGIRQDAQYKKDPTFER